MRITLAAIPGTAGEWQSALSWMGEMVVVVNEGMDTRPICDTQAEAEA